MESLKATTKAQYMETFEAKTRASTDPVLAA